jgi:hypothetical protein
MHMAESSVTCILKAYPPVPHERILHAGSPPQWRWLVREPRRAPYQKSLAPEALDGPLREAVEHERARLMKADSLLGAVAIAMTYADEEPVRAPSFPSLVELARGLVNEAINGLDSVNLGRVETEVLEQTRARHRLG